MDRALPGDEDEVGAWHVGDVRDAGFMSALMARTRPDALAHLAAIPRPTLGAPLEVFATNTQATFVALEAAGDAGVGRVVIASSTSALGTVFPVAAAAPVSPLYAPVDEDHPFLGSDPYALSKQVDEATAATMQRRHGYQVVALRIPNTGPMDAQVARAAAVAADPSILANELWAYLDIRDAARAFALALERDVAGCTRGQRHGAGHERSRADRRPPGPIPPDDAPPSTDRRPRGPVRSDTGPRPARLRGGAPAPDPRG